MPSDIPPVGISATVASHMKALTKEPSIRLTVTVAPVMPFTPLILNISPAFTGLGYAFICPLEINCTVPACAGSYI